MIKRIQQLKERLGQRKDLAFIDHLYQSFPKARVYLVGGAIRDFLLKEEITDLDFAVEGVGKKELAEFLEGEGNIKEVESRAFGVFIFRPRGGRENFDIALPRSENWTGEGYKDLEVDTNVTIKEDLSRRDFSINALAIDLKRYELIDLFGGQRDLKKGVVKAVGRPEERFQEDPSRILRGIRIACQLGFKIDRQTLSAMKGKAGEIIAKLSDGRKRVAEELIAEEFLKSFDADTLRTIKLYDQLGLLKLLLPELEACKGVRQPKNFHSEGDVFKHTLLALKNLEEIKKDPQKIRNKEFRNSEMVDRDFSIELKLGLLFHDIGKPITFTLPSKEKPRISFNEHDDIGAEMANKIIKRMKLAVFPKGSRLYVNRGQVVWLVRKHMILVVAKPKEMRLSTLERYFFNPDNRGKKLLTLSYCDVSATIPPSGRPDYELLERFLREIEKVKGEVKAKQEEERLPPPLLDGHEIMKILKLKPGPRIGEIKDRLRDRELAGELKSKTEAKKWLLAGQGKDVIQY